MLHSTIADQDTKHVYACYAKTFFPKCTDDRKMAILGLEYGVKTPSVVCPLETATAGADQNGSCCSYQSGDCLVPITKYTEILQYYAAFSGLTQPLTQPQAVWRRIVNGDNCTVGRTFSNYLSMEYQCIADSSIINMATAASLSGHFVSAMYPVIEGEDARELCECTVTSNQPKLDIIALDMRLECYAAYENITCSANHSLTFTDREQKKTLVSETDKVLGQNNVVFSTQGSSLTITFRRDNGTRPQMVWFSVQGREPTAMITVRCNKPEISTRSTVNTTTSDEEDASLTAIIAGTVSGAVLILLVIVIMVCKNRSDLAKAENFANRGKIKQVPSSDHPKPKQPQQKTNHQQRGGHEEKTNQQKRRQMKINSPKGLEMSMNDPVYHDVTIPSQGQRQKKVTR
ncbi:uncharacterized protein LOC132544087 [Ylistrum balloti]|uniref:uncharacterized protein LOC132544087 n=1 Tax=Ylistrum balloti TaxID=509963 RepID=UPI002905E577|nr:uncharacterized protein LOC132544087 [Ylistrum balloti]